MSTYLTPMAVVSIDRKLLDAEEPLDEKVVEGKCQEAVVRILMLMTQDEKPVHLAHGYPMEGDKVSIERDDETLFAERRTLIKVGIEVALDRCADPDYQSERLALVKRGLREYLA